MSEISPAEKLFFAALELENADDRAAYLDHACAGDPALRARLDQLLAAHERAGQFLKGTSPEAADPSSAATLVDTERSVGESDDPSELETGNFRLDGSVPTIVESHQAQRSGGFEPGQVVAGRYTLLEVLGEGGMGTVYRAEQSQPVKRQVALKLIKIGMDSRTVLARFDVERQALAMMDHPNIARVYDGGTTEANQPFFVMELVKGVPITEYCDLHRLTVKARLKLFVDACQAVQHAHQKGIIHRDLKPGNVLVTEVDGRPTPKVIDFGVAKATEFSLTEQSLGDTGAIVGTPTYMSPEQADPSSMDIDTRTDVYALGVILYELLAGSPPLDASQFKRGALLEMLRMVREVDPSRPSTKVSTSVSLPNIAASRDIDPAKLQRALAGDLDWIVMKALEKDRTRRYETANGFAADILRHLCSEPVLAAPPSRSYRARKFVRKHRGAVLAASLIFISLIGGLAVSLWQMNRAIVAEGLARTNESKALKSEALAKEQRSRAEERETQAIDAVKRFGDVIVNEPELKNTPALEGLRKRLMKEPLAFFRTLRDQLQADGDTRPESLARLAAAIYGLGYLTAEIGDNRDALMAFRESQAIRQKLADGNPADTGLHRSLAKCYHSIGNMLFSTGKPAEALKSYRSALAIQQRLADANPADTQFQSDLAASLGNIGIVLNDTGEPAEALKSYRSALAIQQRLADANPADTQFQSDLGGIYNNIGAMLAATGKPAEALKPLQSALAIGRKLVLDHPESPDCASDLSGTLNNFAAIDLESKRFEEARVRLREAVKWQRKALAANPTNPTYRQLLAGYLTNLIIASRGLGDPEGVAEAERELAKLRDSDPATVALDARLSAILKGDQLPKDEAERLALAQRAYDKAFHGKAARLWAEALEANPKLGQDRQAGHRYNAACAASLAGCGQGKDDPPPMRPPRPGFASRPSAGSRPISRPGRRPSNPAPRKAGQSRHRCSHIGRGTQTSPASATRRNWPSCPKRNARRSGNSGPTSKPCGARRRAASDFAGSESRGERSPLVDHRIHCPGTGMASDFDAVVLLTYRPQHAYKFVG